MYCTLQSVLHAHNNNNNIEKRLKRNYYMERIVEVYLYWEQLYIYCFHLVLFSPLLTLDSLITCQ